MLRRYIRAQVTLGGLSFAYYSQILLILRFPNALALGLLGGILEFVPVAGWMTSAAAVITVGVLTHAHWIRAAALLGVWRILVDYWIAPRVLGHELELHPLLAIFATMVGGAIGGIIGIYLSIPVVAALRVIWHRLGELKSHTEIIPEAQVAIPQR
jgi:predicted PurR-regulated permease PerM